MKKLTFMIVLVTFSLLTASAQTKKNASVKLTNENIVGIWQLDSPVRAANLGENFRFFKNGEFSYLYNIGHDTRNIIGFKGKFRLEDSSLYLTIKYRIVRVGGKLEAGSLGQDSYLFNLYDTITKTISEKAPEELAPMDISLVKLTGRVIHMNINNRSYFRISKDPEKYK